MPALRDVVLRYMCHAWTSRYRAGALHPNLTRPPGSLADSGSGLWEKGSFGRGRGQGPLLRSFRKEGGNPSSLRQGVLWDGSSCEESGFGVPGAMNLRS